jgi:hypothetical protein
MRVFVKDGDLEGSVKALKEGFRCYPLAQADNPPKQKVVDLSGKSSSIRFMRTMNTFMKS